MAELSIMARRSLRGRSKSAGSPFESHRKSGMIPDAALRVCGVFAQESTTWVERSAKVWHVPLLDSIVSTAP